jgi:hypothetical protein
MTYITRELERKFLKFKVFFGLFLLQEQERSVKRQC